MTEFEKGYEQGYKDGMAGAALPNVNDNGDKIDGYGYAYKTDSRGEPYIHIDSVRNMLKKAADVQPVDRWISVDERLPKTGESVLVYVAINKNLKGFGECKPEIRIGWLDDGGKWALQFSNMDYSEVLCWLPLPELPNEISLL